MNNLYLTIQSSFLNIRTKKICRIFICSIKFLCLVLSVWLLAANPGKADVIAMPNAAINQPYTGSVDLPALTSNQVWSVVNVDLINGFNGYSFPGNKLEILGTPNTIGTYYFSFQIVDPFSGPDVIYGPIYTFSVTVMGPPSASAVSASVNANSSNNSITPSTSSEATSVSIAGNPSHGSASVSGMVLYYTPTSGYVGTDSFTYTAANAYGSSTAATVSITVAQSSQTVSFTSSVPSNPIIGGTYTPTASATSGLTPVISVDASSGSVCTISGGIVSFNAAGTCTLDANQQGNTAYSAAAQAQLSFTVGTNAPGLTISASSTAQLQGVSVTLTAVLSGGSSPTGTITFKDGSTNLGTATLAGQSAKITTTALTVGSHSITAVYSGDSRNATVTSAVTSISVSARSDPRQNATARAQLSSQVTVATRFAQTQVNNTASRLGQLHDLAGSAFNPIAAIGQDSLSRSLAFGDGSVSSEATRQIDASLLLQQAIRGLTDMENQLNLPYHLWTEGSFDFGRLNVDGSRNNRFTTTGITVGIDGRLLPELTAGLALGYGMDHSTFGSDGSASDGTTKTIALYGTLRLMPQTFLDLSAGYGMLRFDQKRWSSDGDVMLSGTRSGKELFESVGISTINTWDGLTLTSYGRADIARILLDGYAESGPAQWALRYDGTASSTLSTATGFKLSYALPAADWGQLIPSTRLEYSHTFGGGYNQSLAYSDLIGGSYTISGAPTVRDTMTTELSMRAITLEGISFDLRYLVTASQNALESQQIRGILRYAF